MAEPLEKEHAQKRLRDPSAKCMQVLDLCLEEIRVRHASAADCLARYPDCADELAPLLQVAESLISLENVRPSSDFKSSTRRALLSLPNPPVWQERLDRRLGSWQNSGPGRIVLGLGLGLFSILAGTRILDVWRQSLPGTLLYPVKRAEEGLELALAQDEETCLQVHISLADRRLDETEALASSGNADRANLAAGEYGREVSETLAVIPNRSNNALLPLASRFRQKLLGHQAELRDKVTRVPLSSRRPLQRALEVSQKGIEQLGLIIPSSR